MQFVSTRGEAPVLGFSDAVLSGLASDGGLYLPQTWPQISPAEIASFAGRPYADVAFAVISRFVEGEDRRQRTHITTARRITLGEETNCRSRASSFF